jgi:4-hydroxy-tetrahydrodipicolinate synthase
MTLPESTMDFRQDGVFLALWTPTDTEGRLLESDLRVLLRFAASRAIHGILALGSTGEFPYLEPATRRKVLELVAEEARGLSVLANISDIRPRVVADLGRSARGLGLAGVAVLPPYFYRVAQADLVEFFVWAGQSAQLPLVLYNYPERTGNRIELETVAAVADRTPVAAVKQSGSDFEYHRALVQLAREKGFVVFTGGEPQLAEAMAMGVTGCVSGLANAVPELVVGAFDAVRAGRASEVDRFMSRLRELGRLMEWIEFPGNVAAAIEARGLPVGTPKSVISPSTRARYRELVGELRRLYVEWNLAEVPRHTASRPASKP